RVDQRRLAVVHVAEERHARRTLGELVLADRLAALGQLLDQLRLGGDLGAHLELDPELLGEEHGRVVVDDRVDVDAEPDLLHRLLQDVVLLDRQRVRELLDRDRRLDRDLSAGERRARARALAARLAALAARGRRGLAAAAAQEATLLAIAQLLGRERAARRVAAHDARLAVAPRRRHPFGHGGGGRAHPSWLGVLRRLGLGPRGGRGA